MHVQTNSRCLGLGFRLTKFPNEYADNIALATDTAHHLQSQLDRFHTYTILKGLTLNTHKTKIMAFCSNPPVFHYNGTPLENVQDYKFGHDPRPHWEDD